MHMPHPKPLQDFMSDLSGLVPNLLRLRPYEVDLLRSGRKPPPLAWLLLIAGSVSLIGAALACAPGWTRKAELAQQRTKIETALARLGAVPSVPAGGASGRHTSARNAASAGLVEAVAVLTDLRRPWHELFDRLEAAENKDVHVLQLSVEPRFATVQLIAEGRDLDKLVRFSQRLAGGGPIRAVTITHYEWRDALGAHVVSAAMQGELAGALASAGGTAQ
jgi:hypothetical protein